MRLHFHGGPEDGRCETVSANPNPIRAFRRPDNDSVYVNRYTLVATYTDEAGERLGHYEWTDEKVEALV